MQTFLPYAAFQKSATVLDFRRLGKQRVESRQILQTLRYGGGWANHPVVKMWRGYEDALIAYGNTMILAWVTRGYRNNMELMPYEWDYKYPPWFGDRKFHAAHRSNLLRKNVEHYGQFGWAEKPDMPYVWPV